MNELLLVGRPDSHHTGNLWTRTFTHLHANHITEKKKDNATFIAVQVCCDQGHVRKPPCSEARTLAYRYIDVKRAQIEKKTAILARPVASTLV